MNTESNFSRLMFITNRKLSVRPLSEIVESACASGVKLVQLREKDLNGKSLYELAVQLREVTSRHDAKLFINDRLDIALAVNADGIVIPETGLAVQTVKKIKPEFLVGRSVHSIDGAREAEASGADFLIAGHIFETPSKPNALPRGLALLHEISSTVKIPVFAVGGITPENARQCTQSGAFGVAAMSSVMQSADISKTIQAFQAALNSK
jgi:thiamine-phosphate pyrophosphorylase